MLGICKLHTTRRPNRYVAVAVAVLYCVLRMGYVRRKYASALALGARVRGRDTAEEREHARPMLTTPDPADDVPDEMSSSISLKMSVHHERAFTYRVFFQSVADHHSYGDYVLRASASLVEGSRLP